MKKFNPQVIFMSFAIVLVSVAILLTQNNFSQNYVTELEVKEYATQGEITKCNILEVENSKKTGEYSFDNGKTWQKDNYAVFCNDNEQTVEIKSKNDSGKITGVSTVYFQKDLVDTLVSSEPGEEINSISFGEPSYNCKIGDKLLLNLTSDPVNYVGELTVKSDAVSARLLSPVNCPTCAIESNHILVNCDKAGVSKISVSVDNGPSTSTNIIVGDVVAENNVGNIKYNSSSFICKTGEKITATITATDPFGISRIKKYNSSDSSIATIEKHPTLAIKCINCVAVQINCKKEGKVLLNAESTTGAKTSVPVNVTDSQVNIGTIKYESLSYTCKPGQKIDTKITTEGTIGNIAATIKSFSSANINIATVEKHPTLAIKCINCVAVQITCKEQGNVTLNAESSTGAKTSSKVNVLSAGSIETGGVIGKIYYDNPYYTCKPGQKIDATIKVEGVSGNKVASIKSYSSSNLDIATVEKHPTNIIKCIDCVAVQITCKTVGSVVLNAESTFGATGKASVNVLNAPTDIGKISFEKTSYSCAKGTSFVTTINTTQGSSFTTVKSWSSSDTNIATIYRDYTLGLACTNCVSVKVNCNTIGTANLKAYANTGATVSVPVTVNELPVNIGTIKYEASSYTCKPGQTIDTTITAEGGFALASIKSYTSSNPNVATVVKNPNITIKCINCVAVQITCKTEGKVTLSAESTLGAITSVPLTVNESPVNIGTIKYEASSYTCKPGQTIDTTITAEGGSALASIKSYTSSNTNIATIVKHPTLVIKCINCVAVQITCKTEGKVTLSAESTLGAITSVPVTVTAPVANIGKIYYQNPYYTCKPGQTIDTTITADEGSTLATIKSYSSSNVDIATVVKNPNITIKCINCVAVQIACKTVGNVVLNAESSLGAKTTSTVNVLNPPTDIGKISFEKTSYSCKKGTSFITTIKTVQGSSFTAVKSWSSSDTNIATIYRDYTLELTCTNCVSVKVSCKNTGNVTLNAFANTGAVGKSTLNIYQ